MKILTNNYVHNCSVVIRLMRKMSFSEYTCTVGRTLLFTPLLASSFHRSILVNFLLNSLISRLKAFAVDCVPKSIVVKINHFL